MGEHYTKNTKECMVHCSKCGRDTLHRVDGGRRGPCLDCLARMEQEIATTGGLSKAQQARRAKAEKARQNPTLFEK